MAFVAHLELHVLMLHLLNVELIFAIIVSVLIHVLHAQLQMPTHHVLLQPLSLALLRVCIEVFPNKLHHLVGLGAHVSKALHRLHVVALPKLVHLVYLVLLVLLLLLHLLCSWIPKAIALLHALG